MTSDPQITVISPRGKVTIDVGLKDILYDIWDLQGINGYCRTIYSCQGGERSWGREDAYVMFEYGFEKEVEEILRFYGRPPLCYEECWNSVWPRWTWSIFRFEALGVD